MHAGEHLSHVFGKLKTGRCNCKIPSVCGVPGEGVYKLISLYGLKKEKSGAPAWRSR